MASKDKYARIPNTEPSCASCGVPVVFGTPGSNEFRQLLERNLRRCLEAPYDEWLREPRQKRRHKPAGPVTAENCDSVFLIGCVLNREQRRPKCEGYLYEREGRVTRIGTDREIAELTYHVLVYESGPLPSLPWGEETFDCILFPPSSGGQDRMEELLDQLPYTQIDWVHVAEPGSQHWHDRVDQKSVDKGVQEKVGDGHPMTVWDEDLKSLSDWDTSDNHGASDHFLFVFTDSDVALKARIQTIKRKISER